MLEQGTPFKTLAKERRQIKHFEKHKNKITIFAHIKIQEVDEDMFTRIDFNHPGLIQIRIVRAGVSRTLQFSPNSTYVYRSTAFTVVRTKRVPF